MTVAIDTNVLLDILLPDLCYKDSSMGLLMQYLRKDKLIISEVVYAELASQFEEEKLLNDFLRDTGIALIPSSPSALWIAARAWKKYSEARSISQQCSKCGKLAVYTCPECKSAITSRQHIISDFIIAGNAIAEAGKLLTRDRGFYKTCFAGLITESGLP